MVTRSLTYEQHLRKIGLPTFEYRRPRQDLIQVYRILESIDELDYKHFFELVNSTQTNHQLRGHPCKIYKARYNKRIIKNYFSHRVVHT